MLQWGHNFFVMEICTASAISLYSSLGFNGAITFSLWKFPTSTNANHDKEMASMGP